MWSQFSDDFILYLLSRYSDPINDDDRKMLETLTEEVERRGL